VKPLVEFPLEQGGSVLVEIDAPPAGLRGHGRDQPTLAERTDETFEGATAAVTRAAASLIARLRSISSLLAEIGIESGVQLSAQTGAFIASAGAAADFKVPVAWRGGAAET